MVTPEAKAKAAAFFASLEVYRDWVICKVCRGKSFPDAVSYYRHMVVCIKTCQKVYCPRCDDVVGSYSALKNSHECPKFSPFFDYCSPATKEKRKQEWLKGITIGQSSTGGGKRGLGKKNKKKGKKNKQKGKGKNLKISEQKEDEEVSGSSSEKKSLSDGSAAGGSPVGSFAGESLSAGAAGASESTVGSSAGESLSAGVAGASESTVGSSAGVSLSAGAAGAGGSPFAGQPEWEVERAKALKALEGLDLAEYGFLEFFY